MSESNRRAVPAGRRRDERVDGTTDEPPPGPTRPDVRAAGVVVFRPGREVLLVHRPKYDDWSFPKGKLDRGEHAVAAAVREVAEETGVHVRLGPPLASQRYRVGDRMKTVDYWTGRVVANDDVAAYRPNDEIDGVRWVPIDDAPDLLTYPRDRDTLVEARAVRRRTHALVVLRHAPARARQRWRGDDRLRPLLKSGETVAQRLVPLLAAYDAGHVVSSTNTRCVQTVQPWVEVAGYDIDLRPRLSEERATQKAVARVVEELLGSDAGAVLCTHRPVLPMVWEALGISAPEPLEPGEMLVLHVRKERIVAVERHGGS